MSAQRHSFGRFSFEKASGTLFRDREPLNIGRRGAALLTALIEADGNPVPKDNLLSAGWPNQIVDEANLSVQIATLRKVLGQNESGAAWIATVPRVGYRFLRSTGTASKYSEPLRPVLGVWRSDGLAEASSGYFAHGVVDGIVAALSRFREFAVAAPRVVSGVQQQDAGVQAIADRLGVRYLLRCTAQQASDRFRISVHLVDGTSGLELWAKRFDGTISEVFDFEDRIAESVAGLVAPAISRAEIERARRKRPDNLDAYDLYLRALPLFRTIDPDARSELIRLLEGCVRLDPHFAAGLAHAAWAYERQGTFGTGMSDGERARALELANSAAEEGNDDPQVVAISAVTLILAGGERQRGLAMLREAYIANPNNTMVMRMYAFGNVFVGDLELGRQTFMRSLEISPASLMTYEILEGLSLSHLLKGEYEQAAEWAQRSIAVNGQWPAAYWNLASAYGHLGQTADAADAVKRLLTLAPSHRLSHFLRIEPSYETRHKILVDGLRLAGLPS